MDLEHAWTLNKSHAGPYNKWEQSQSGSQIVLVGEMEPNSILISNNYSEPCTF